MATVRAFSSALRNFRKNFFPVIMLKLSYNTIIIIIIYIIITIIYIIITIIYIIIISFFL